MRDPKRIPKLLKKLEALWMLHPDLRFWQLIEYIKSSTGGIDMFYVEDDESEAIIVDLMAKNPAIKHINDLQSSASIEQDVVSETQS